MKYLFFLLLITIESLHASKVDLKDTIFYNPTAYITSQCYTKTIHEKDNKLLSNPCYSCHRKNKIPNFTSSDSDLQEEYSFPSSALKNPWINLFKDRTKQVSKISDQEILKYIKQNNYIDKNRNIILAKKLKNLPTNWDANNNGKWDGYIPDCYYNFDKEGFDRNNKGDITGWRAFAYYPFLGTFWPTNGSIDDVLIRLPKIFWKDKKGKIDLEVYKTNLSIVESLLKQKDISIENIDESKFGIDLNKNGKIDIASKIVFKWKIPDYDISTNKLKNFTMSYVGLAQIALLNNQIHIAPGLYPKGTEFLHSVRYLDITKNSQIKISSRMKELRYAKKRYWSTYSQLEQISAEEMKDESDYPDRAEKYTGNIEIGLNNKRGWYYQGFIEDEKGNLRPQSKEETLYCIGCHSNIGAIADSTFVFQRKFDTKSLKYGWYHWTQKGLKGINDKKLISNKTEYARYLQLNKSGDEFRANDEIMKKFFNKDLSLKKDALNKLKKDITFLIMPSKQRALKLNKAYKVIVEEQSFIYGRDAHIKPINTVHKVVKENQLTKIKKVNN
ncbi:hypothetical protein [Arcobacter sp. CECT 8985]|uniref:hypothetical protein n=1 Tax=Arcobacter sp. CECT 8985 TaxID=1935424 RepID=UPI00100C1394|nr:hypothetical protein [Arcobacter sp. CECT 8985]RXJ86316.1 hypothetical protein CRU93_09105 [Arcobacter sp. CECT 8985]